MSSVPIEDHILWIRFIKGDTEAFSMLFLRHAGSLYKYGTFLCRDSERIEDCIQDLFFQLWINRDKQREVKCVRTYLFAALNNHIKGSYRKTRVFNTLEKVDGSVQKEISTEEQWIDRESMDQKHDLINRGIQTLPSRMKQAVYLRYFESLDYAEIATIMNIRRQVAINMVYRALNHLRDFSREYATLLLVICIMSMVWS